MPWFAGIEREKINWSPQIDYKKCVSCGMCMNCGKKVFTWGDDNKPHVTNPTACVVGCTTCGNLCLGKAIKFPSIEELREVYKKHRVWQTVKKILENEGKIP